MARPASRHPTELELEILKVLWRQGPLTGRQVRDALVPFRDLAYTSVMTVMKIMTQKGYLRREKSPAGYLYRPCVAEEDVGRRMVGDLIERVFDGSAAALMLNLLETKNLDSEELRQIRDIIDQEAGKSPS